MREYQDILLVTFDESDVVGYYRPRPEPYSYHSNYTPTQNTYTLYRTFREIPWTPAYQALYKALAPRTLVPVPTFTATPISAPFQDLTKWTKEQKANPTRCP